MGVYPEGLYNSFGKCPLLNEYGRVKTIYQGEGENHGKIQIFNPEPESERNKLTDDAEFMMHICKLCDYDPFHRPSIENMNEFIKSTGQTLMKIVTLINGPEDFSIEGDDTISIVSH
jgi:hypothetical protein